MALWIMLGGCGSPGQNAEQAEKSANTPKQDEESSSQDPSVEDQSPKPESPKSEEPDSTQPSPDKDQSSEENNEEDPGESELPEGKLPKFDLGVLPDPEKAGDDCECEEGADLVYVLSDLGEIWSFDPRKKDASAFKKIGKPNCRFPSGSDLMSMGVDRHANAWVSIQPSGRIYEVNTKTNTCKNTGHKPGKDGFRLVGMAFVEHPNDGRCEQLYLHSFSGNGVDEGKNAGKLGVVDPENMSLKRVGLINFDGGELTGTKDGRLFAFAGVPGRLLEYNPKTAKVIKETSLGKFDLTSAFAFAFWGGDFYFFTEGKGGSRSKVTKLDYKGDGSLRTVIERVPMRIVGAGVSVCAPLDDPAG